MRPSERPATEHQEHTVNITTATPAEIDSKLYEFYLESALAERNREAALVQIHRAVGDDKTYRKPSYSLTHEEAIAKATEQAKGDDFLGAARKGMEALAAA
jgi:hypothetical protein